MDNSKEVFLNDDDDDLEALRLAALQSLKKKSSTSNGEIQPGVPNLPSYNESSIHVKQNRSRKGFGSKRGNYFVGRGLKNGQHYNNRTRTSNLISITPVEKDLNKDMSDESTFSRPQDRYCVRDQKSDGKIDESSSKFDRYNESDRSDEESEEDTPKCDSEDNSSPKLKKADSLEALMQELDEEIHGKPKSKDKEEKQTVKKQKDTVKIEDKTINSEQKEEEPIVEVEIQPENSKPEPIEEQPALTTIATAKEKPVNVDQPKPKKRKHYNRRDFHGYMRNQPPPVPYQNPQFIPSMPPLPFHPMIGPPPPMFNPVFGPPNVVLPINAVPFFERPLPPLSIDTDTLQTQAMAPLSPRSAAFVLENRAIIEKRKRSPRRSYSRSPSPRRRSPSITRRSLSPRRRSRSPKRRSKSPRRKSISPRMRQFSPKARPFSPKLRLSGSLSPKLKAASPSDKSCSPKRRSSSPKRREKKELYKPSIRDRLGFKNNTKPETKDTTEKTEAVKKTEEQLLDPVLEARKRKFESREIQVKEGVIRLKPSYDPKPEPKEELDVKPIKTDTVEVLEKPKQVVVPIEDLINEDILLEDDELDLESKIDLFSDEEFESDHEDRFKTKEQDTNKQEVLSFSKLNSASKNVLNRSETTSKRKRPTESKSSRNRISSQRRNKQDSLDKILIRGSKESSRSRSSLKNLTVKSDRRPNTKQFERKIEIKIKNPSKYDKNDKARQEKRSDEKRDRGNKKADLENAKIDDDDDDETEIVVENDEDEIENSVNDEDLRTQLSKKRAGKLNKNASIEGGSSRLLQNAFQNVLPLKKAKKSKSQELSSNDGKLPIHLRLGTCSAEIFNSTKRKTRKRKNVESEGQV